jgi:hypothetical protein
MAGQPDLVVIGLESTGRTFVNQEGQVTVPIRVVVRNQGNGDADIFKVATEYSGGAIAPERTFVVTFLAESTAEVDPANGGYPFTRRSLPAGGEVTFGGTVIFHPSERGVTVSLTATVDSCSGDELMPDYCRVQESNEANNLSAPVSLLLPPLPIIIR